MKRSGAGVAGLMAGGFTAGLVSFGTVIFLTLWQWPKSNLAPVAGCMVAPYAAFVGAFLGWTILVVRTMSLPGAILLGLLAGTGSVIFVYWGNWNDLGSSEGARTTLASLCVFGLTGVVTWLVRYIGPADPVKKQEQKS